MGKNPLDTGKSDRPGPSQRSQPATGAIGILTVLGVAIVLVLSVVTWNSNRSLQQSLETQLGQVQGSVARLEKTLQDSAARAAAPPPRQGPDPNRVYPVKTQGSPAEGPATAPITIAEFSDFQ